MRFRQRWLTPRLQILRSKSWPNLEGASSSYDSLTAFYSYMNQMPTDTFAVDVHGAVSGTAPAQALQFAKSKGMARMALKAEGSMLLFQYTRSRANRLSRRC